MGGRGGEGGRGGDCEMEMNVSGASCWWISGGDGAGCWSWQVAALWTHADSEQTRWVGGDRRKDWQKSVEETKGLLCMCEVGKKG